MLRRGFIDTFESEAVAQLALAHFFERGTRLTLQEDEVVLGLAVNDDLIGRSRLLTRHHVHD